ncbi:MAG: hemolysin family protein [Micrococcales bacterium]
MSEALNGIIWFFVLLIGNAFFVGSEFAVISAKRAKIELRAEDGSGAAKITLKAMDRVSIMLAATQIGVTVCSLLILLIAEPAIHHLLAVPFESLGMGAELEGIISFSVALILVSSLHVLLGEMIPKQLAFAVPERAALILVPLLYGFALITKPLVVSLNAIANGVLRLFRIKPRDSANTAYTIEQVEDIVEHSTREGVLSDTSGAISNTFEFTEKKVKDISIPLRKVVAFPITVTPAEIEAAVSKHGYSRYPLTQNGEITGYLHLKDVLDLRDDELADPFPEKRVRQLTSFSENTEVEDALAGMRRTSSHLAKVINRKGETVGIVFLEDIIEELVGEVRDVTN